MSKESEAYRLEMLRRLENKYGKAKPAEVLEAEKVIAKFREQEAADREAIARLGSPLPEPHLCPECYYLHGKTSRLEPVPSGTKHDKFKCGRCGFIQERKMGW
jgi:hypothetical protein